MTYRLSELELSSISLLFDEDSKSRVVTVPFSVNTSAIKLSPPSQVVVGVIWNGSEIKAGETYTGVCIYIYIHVVCRFQAAKGGD